MKHFTRWIDPLARRWRAVSRQRRHEIAVGALGVVLSAVTLVAFHDVVTEAVARAEVERPLASGTQAVAPDAPIAPGVGTYTR